MPVRTAHVQPHTHRSNLVLQTEDNRRQAYMWDYLCFQTSVVASGIQSSLQLLRSIAAVR